MLSNDFGPDSDVDVLVEFKTDTRIGPIRFTGLELELSEMLGGKVSLNTSGYISTLSYTSARISLHAIDGKSTAFSSPSFSESSQLPSGWRE